MLTGSSSSFASSLGRESSCLGASLLLLLVAPPSWLNCSSSPKTSAAYIATSAASITVSASGPSLLGLFLPSLGFAAVSASGLLELDGLLLEVDGLLLGVAGNGLLGGALGFGVSEIVKHKDDIKRGFEDVGEGIASAAKSVGGFFKSIF